MEDGMDLSGIKNTERNSRTRCKRSNDSPRNSSNDKKLEAKQNIRENCELEENVPQIDTIKENNAAAQKANESSAKDVPIMSVFQKGIVDSLSLVEHMSTEERDVAISALKDIVDSSKLWKQDGTSPPAPETGPRPRGRPKGSKKQKTVSSESTKVKSEQPSSYSTTDNITTESSQSRVHENIPEGTRRSSRTVKPTYKVKDTCPKQVRKKESIKKSVTAQKYHSIDVKAKEGDRDDESGSSEDDKACKTEPNVESVSKETDGETEGNDSEDVEIPQTLTVNDCKVTIKVKEEPDKIKDKENKPDELVPAKQYKMDKDVKRFLQKTGQLKAKKKTMMSEVKHSTTTAATSTTAATTNATTTTATTTIATHDPEQSPAQLAALEKEGGEGEGDQGTSMETESTQATEQEDLGTSVEEEGKEIVELNERNRVCVRGFWLIKQDHGNGWRCETCGKVSLYRASGICHLRTHSKDRPFDCPKCPKKFSFKPNRQRHMSTAHNINSVICRVCQAGFGRRQELIRHSQEKHGLTSAQVNNYCSICDKSFNQRSSYKSHVKYKHSSHKAIYICQFCPKSFNFQSNLIRHVKIHTGDRPHKCAYCDAAFIERKSLIIHQMKSHDTPEVRAMLDVTQKYNCRICDKEFMSKGNLIVHQRVHTKEKPFACPICPKTFSMKANLKRHEATHRGERPYQCPDCLKRFTEKRSMEIHRRLHTGEKPYQCDICLKRFAQLGTLNSHKPVHSKERNFKCPHCAATFLRSSHLSTHIRKHDKDTPLQCQHCNVSFTDRNELMQHELTHSLVAEPSLTCPLCPEKFTSNERLSQHLYSHMGYKLYQCTMCGEMFESNKAASVHLSQKHAEEYKYNHTHEDGKEMIAYLEPALLPAGEEDKGGDYPTHIVVTDPTQTSEALQEGISSASQLAAEGMVSLAGTANRTIIGSESESTNSHPQLISQETYEQLLSQAHGVGTETSVGVMGGGGDTRQGGGVPELVRDLAENVAGGEVRTEEMGGGAGVGELTAVGPGETAFTVQYQDGKMFLITKQQ